MSTGSHLQVGYVARVHGLRGEVVVKTFDPASEVLFQVERIVLRPREGGEARTLTVEDTRTAGKDILVALAGVSTRESAQQLVGSTLLVFREDLEPPGEGEYFQGDLIGLEAVDAQGTVLGRVEEIWSTGEVPTLVIRGGPQELLLPFADDFVDTVDLDARRMVVKPPELTE